MSAEEWAVLPVGIDAQSLERRHGDHLARLGAYRMLDASGWAAEAAREVHEFAVPLLHGLAERPGSDGRKLGESLRMSPEESYWWFLEISEKSPMRGSLIQDLYTLALVRRAMQELQCDAVYLQLAHSRLAMVLGRDAEMPPVARGLSRLTWQHLTPNREWLYWFWAVWHLLLLFGVRTVARLGRWPDSPPLGAVQFFTMYPGWWLGAGSANASDRFFPNMPRGHGDKVISYSAWISGRPWTLWYRRRKLGAVMHRNWIVPIQRFVPLGAAIALLSPGRFWRLRTFRRNCEQSTLPRFLRFDVTSLISREISRSIGASEFALTQLLFAGTRRMLNLTRPSAMVFRAECQPVERALLYAGRQRTRMIGFWHSAIALCDNYLPFHFPGESLGPCTDPTAIAPMPVPDAMLATGDICERTLTRQGYPAARVIRCGPIRHREALAMVRLRPDRMELRAALKLPLQARVVFVATSVVPTDARAMLGAVADSAASLRDCMVVLKVHPASTLSATDFREFRAALKGATLRECTSNEAMYGLVAASDIVVTGGTTLAFEAIALGVMPIVFENPHAFCATSFEAFERACFIARNSTELREAMRSIMREDPSATEKREQWAGLSKQVFGDLTADLNVNFLFALTVAVDLPERSAEEDATR